MRRVVVLSLFLLFLCGVGVFADSAAQSVPSVVEEVPLTIIFTPDIIFLTGLLFVLVGLASAILSAFLMWLFKIRTMNNGVLRFDMVMETASVDHQLGGTLQVIIFSTKDQNVASAFSSVHKRMSSCFREIGFQVFFSETLQIELEKYPTMIAVDYKKNKRPVKAVERLFRRHKDMVNLPVMFYNVPNPSEFETSLRIPNSYILGEMFKEQDLMKVASTVVQTAEKGQPNVLQGSITGDGISEILQLLELGKRTGMLKIRDSKKQLLGEMGFHVGVVVFARSARGVGDVAALDIVGFKTGRFNFVAQEIEIHNCELTATSLIMHSAQLEDEQYQGYTQTQNFSLQ